MLSFRHHLKKRSSGSDARLAHADCALLHCVIPQLGIGFELVS